jgi:hypothetical protein
MMVSQKVVTPLKNGVQEFATSWEHYRGGKARLPELSPLRTGRAVLPHPALQSMVILARTEAGRDGHRKG